MTAYHIYNSGVENRVIFVDDEDRKTFEKYVKEYLSPPADPNSVSKSFSVNGKIYKGVPHQPKNYFGKISLNEIILTPHQFHLILEQNMSDTIQSFMRSLCTRYSMYFNKKYSRNGSLFAGPYKSSIIEGPEDLESLKKSISNVVDSASVTTEDSTLNKTDELPFEIHLSNKPKKSQKTYSKIPEIAAFSFLFLVLTSLGFRNITVTQAKNIAISQANAPAVLSETVETIPEPQKATKTLVIVELPKGKEWAEIRLEPSDGTNLVGKAKSGDTFDYLGTNSGWYQVSSLDGLSGFIKTEYAILQETIK